MAKISVLVPVYNVEKYLEKCLDSILCQTFSDMEILCMDDGSTDASAKLLDQYAKRDARVRVVHKKNTGYGNTMNQAIQLASGTYIGIVESDDYIDANMYQVLYEYMEKHRLDMVKSDYYQLWDREDLTEYKVYHKLTEDADMYDRVLEPNKETSAYFAEKFTWNGLYRKDFLLEHGIRYNETAGASYQDNGFWFQTLYFAKRMMFVQQAFYQYRQDNPNSSINSTSKVDAMKYEYDSIHAFLNRQKEKQLIFYQICFHFRLSGYLYTLKKLAEPLKQDYADLLLKECETYEALGEACYAWLNKSDLALFQPLRQDARGYLEQMLTERKKIREIMTPYSQVIVYGAGSYGRRIFEKLKESRIDTQPRLDLAVTSLQSKKEYYLQKTIYELQDFLGQQERCLVILAVKKDSPAYKEMCAYLQRQSFSKVMTYEELERQLERTS